MDQIKTIDARPSFVRRLWDDFHLLCAAMDLSELELTQLRLSQLSDQVADLRRATASNPKSSRR